MIWISSWILFITMSQIPIFEFIKLRLKILNQLFKNGSFQPSTNFCFIFINIKLLRITIA